MVSLNVGNVTHSFLLTKVKSSLVRIRCSATTRLLFWTALAHTLTAYWPQYKMDGRSWQST
jgi:hypothetical protein